MPTTNLTDAVPGTRPTTTYPDRRKRKRRWVVTASVAVALMAGLGVWGWLGHRAPPPNADVGSLSRYMASPAFADLPERQKASYLDAYQRAKARGELTPEQINGVSSNVEMGGEKDPLDSYLSLPRGKEREKFLDDVIDRVLKSDKEAKRRPLPPGTAGPPEARGDARQADAGPPEGRARLSQFLQDLHDRRAARGVPDDGKFLFPRPQ